MCALCLCLARVWACLACRRDEIALCGRLLGVSAHALNSNPGLILLIVVTKIVMTLAVLPIFAFMFLAYTNGHIARNGESPTLHERRPLRLRQEQHQWPPTYPVSPPKWDV